MSSHSSSFRHIDPKLEAQLSAKTNSPEGIARANKKESLSCILIGMAEKAQDDSTAIL